MNIETLRTMVNHIKIEPEDYMTNTVDGIEAQVKAKSVTDMIARALCVEYNEACEAEDGLDFYYKASGYVNKQYCALIAISHDCWSDYIHIHSLCSKSRDHPPPRKLHYTLRKAPLQSYQSHF